MDTAAWEVLRGFDAHRAHAHLVALADPALGGRAPGSPGEAAAAGYLERALGALGARQLWGMPRREPFPLEVAVLGATPRLEVEGAGPLALLRDFSVNVQGAAGGGRVAGAAVWIGAPGEERRLGAELAGKVAVGWASAATGDQDLEERFEAYLGRLRRTRDAGGLALLQVAPRVDRIKAMIHRREAPGIPCLDVSPTLGQRLFAPFPPPLGTAGARLALDLALDFSTVACAGNVCGVVGDDPPALLLTAHYDHLAALPDGRAFDGAVDNASGVAVALEVARVLGAQPHPGRGVGVLFTAAEEIGMVGAARFVDAATGRLAPGVAVLILDEVAGAQVAPLALLCGPGFVAPEPDPQIEADLGAPLRPAPLPPVGFADHVPFMERTGASVAILSCPAAGAAVAHTVADRARRVTPAGLSAAGRATLLVALRLLVKGR